MKSIGLIFPHQLFSDHPILAECDEVFLVEEYLFFRSMKFHKKKLVLHRASMKSYEKQLAEHGIRVTYLPSAELKRRRAWISHLRAARPDRVIVCDVVDDYLGRDLERAAHDLGCELVVRETPAFLVPRSENQEYVASRTRPFFMKTYYAWQRKRMNIFMDPDGKPAFGAYSFDTQNRKRFPKEYREPDEYPKEYDLFLDEACRYVDQNFPDAYGETSGFSYAYTAYGARRCLRAFLRERLSKFGDYEDAIRPDIAHGNHSVISPYLNIGILSPQEVVSQLVSYYEDHTDEVAFNNVEGFLRQVIGWREFVRMVYEHAGVAMRTRNFFSHHAPVPRSFWTGEPSGNVVIDATISKVVSHAYVHHIERLMVLGNYLLLSRCDPDQVYQWFMEMFIDAYDWVMVPNVYGMSQYADGGLFATKPYICASNYILKMSSYKRDGVWDAEFDEKFWSFLDDHANIFRSNPRLRMLVARRSKK